MLLDIACCRHAATLDSSSPASSTSQDASDVRQRLSFDWQDSRFAETAEPDPLSSARSQHAQQAHQAPVNLAESFQKFNFGHSTHSSLSKPNTGLAHQLSAPPSSLHSMHSSASKLKAGFAQHSKPPSGAATPCPIERGQSLGYQGQDSLANSGNHDKNGESETHICQALSR